MTIETLDVLGAPMIVKRAEGVFLAEHPIPPGYFVPPHRHDTDDEMLFVVEGEVTLIGEGGESRLGAGGAATFALANNRTMDSFAGLEAFAAARLEVRDRNPRRPR